MKEKLTTDDVADFGWDFGMNFILETSKGTYIWSDPDYRGDNTIKPLKTPLEEWLRDGLYLRGKGKHRIGDYCGEDVKILDE